MQLRASVRDLFLSLMSPSQLKPFRICAQALGLRLLPIPMIRADIVGDRDESTHRKDARIFDLVFCC